MRKELQETKTGKFHLKVPKKRWSGSLSNISTDSEALVHEDNWVLEGMGDVETSSMVADEEDEIQPVSQA